MTLSWAVLQGRFPRHREAGLMATVTNHWIGFTVACLKCLLVQGDNLLLSTQEVEIL